MTKQSFLGAGLMLSLALMAGRLVGFFRELLLASIFGISAKGDAAIVLLTLPDLLVNLLLSGGLGVALIPAIRQASQAQKYSLIKQSSLLVVALFGVFGVVFALVPSFIFALLAPGIDAGALSLNYHMLAAVALAIPLTALSGVTTAALNAEDRFFLAGCGTLIFNTIIVTALFAAVKLKSNELFLVSMGIGFGALLRLGSQVIPVIVFCRKISESHASKWMISGDLIKVFITGISAASLLILVPVVIRSCASYLGEGVLTAFNYATKLVELPLGILITTLATIAYPKLSSAFFKKDEDGFQRILYESLLKSLLLSISVALCGWQFSDAVVNLLFGFDKITDIQREEISSLTKIAMLSVPFVGISGLFAAAHNARNNSADVLRNNATSLFLLMLLMLPGLFIQSASWLISLPR